jgi:hypothetical protein
MSNMDDASKSEVTDESREPTAAPPVDKKHVRDILVEENSHRRKKEAQVFSWSSSVLGGIIGGTVALTGALILFAVTALGAIWPR